MQAGQCRRQAGQCRSQAGQSGKGQADIQRQLYRMDRKISDTYNLALDAWGQGVENRKWLEGSSKIEA